MGNYMLNSSPLLVSGSKGEPLSLVRQQLLSEMAIADQL